MESGNQFIGIWLDLPRDILEDRINKRRNTASDATVSVLRAQLAQPVSKLDWHKVDASGSIEETIKRLDDLLQTRGLSPLNIHSH